MPEGSTARPPCWPWRKLEHPNSLFFKGREMTAEYLQSMLFCTTFSLDYRKISSVTARRQCAYTVYVSESGSRAKGKGSAMASEYDVHRQGWRLECGDRCVLQHNGKSAECILVDISVSGVLVSCDDGFAERLHPGDMCSLFLCGDPLVCPSEIECIVTRRDTSRIGLQFPSGT